MFCFLPCTKCIYSILNVLFNVLHTLKDKLGGTSCHHLGYPQNNQVELCNTGEYVYCVFMSPKDKLNTPCTSARLHESPSVIRNLFYTHYIDINKYFKWSKWSCQQMSMKCLQYRTFNNYTVMFYITLF